MVKRRGDGIYDKRALSRKCLTMGARDWLHHMSPVTRADNDASLMFPRQDKQIGSDNSDVTKEAEMAGYKSIHCPHLVKHFLHFSGQDMTEHPGLTTNTKCQPEV